MPFLWEHPKVLRIAERVGVGPKVILSRHILQSRLRMVYDNTELLLPSFMTEVSVASSSHLLSFYIFLLFPSHPFLLSFTCNYSSSQFIFIIHLWHIIFNLYHLLSCIISPILYIYLLSSHLHIITLTVLLFIMF